MFRFVCDSLPNCIPQATYCTSSIANIDPQHKTLDVITLFHKASSPASIRVHTLLRQASATASETATEDQASDHSAQSNPKTHRAEFKLEVTEEPPTEDQLRSILEYIGAQKAGTIIKGAKDEADAMRKLAANGDSFERPVVGYLGNGNIDIS